MNQAERLRELMAGERLAMAPGASDSLTARLVEQAGFPAVYMTGFGATASRLGAPDIGLLTQTEMAAHARDMVRAVGIPVIADADTGYGGPANIERTVREYVQAGAAAIHLEDQASPKRCGQMAGVRLIPAEEGARRLQCALDARGGADLVVIARTDALAAQGVEEAVRRGNAYRQAGADVVFVDAIRRIADAEAVARGIDAPLMISIVEGNETTQLSADEVKRMGFALAVYPLSALLSATRAVQDVLAELRDRGTTHGKLDRMATYSEFGRVVGLDHYGELDGRFGSG
ncbi:MAG: isocitrate lyase/PEP mutase family protein [Gemmatimonadetes bacterium]|nr:isocitrate lyase/PEP mutase family protein [Gemmatimonadota bacterium]